jgi:hypothetical protein
MVDSSRESVAPHRVFGVLLVPVRDSRLGHPIFVGSTSPTVANRKNMVTATLVLIPAERDLEAPTATSAKSGPQTLGPPGQAENHTPDCILSATVATRGHSF